VRIAIKGLKVSTLLPPSALTPDLVGPEGQPAGAVAIELDLEGVGLVRAVLNGKSVRKAIRAIAEHGPDNVCVLLQGNLVAGPTPASCYSLDAPGLSATPKAAPATSPDPTGEPRPSAHA
jgi:hypothetical protein